MVQAIFFSKKNYFIPLIYTGNFFIENCNYRKVKTKNDIFYLYDQGGYDAHYFGLNIAISQTITSKYWIEHRMYGFERR